MLREDRAHGVLGELEEMRAPGFYGEQSRAEYALSEIPSWSVQFRGNDEVIFVSGLDAGSGGGARAATHLGEQTTPVQRFPLDVGQVDAEVHTRAVLRASDD